MIYLLDTDTCIAVLRKKPTVLAKLQALSPDDCGISSITAFELFAGVEKARDPKAERAKLDQFFSVVDVLNFEEAAAAQGATVRAKLEKAGTPIGPYDLLIAGHALALGVILATGNTDEFKRVPGLRLETWT
ncbi:MAG TPA: type II toxin-antitoxin system VapC family toxin [Candidatus Acidoferrum sp.]|nr:type II toxin-antitoxin system VapC family toxin [Candidatus Acidoferrum sp.]